MPRKQRPMLLTIRLAFFLLLTILIVSRVRSQSPKAAEAPLNLELATFVSPGQLDQPVDIAHAGGEELYVVEKEGRIRTVNKYGDVAPVPFLDIRERVLSSGPEQGLLGLVFHPDYENNGYFYVNYTAEPDMETHVSRFSVDPQTNVADPDSELFVLTVPQPNHNHNAGDLAFGPDGYLYIPLGDGGRAYDPDNRAQDLRDLLGKILRVDVSGQASRDADCGTPGNYTLPEDNPFVDGLGNDCDEIWALGLRNPWRISFDLPSGNLYIGDVGQNSWEEVNFQPAPSIGGENYGWRCYEGTHETPEQYRTGCDSAGAYEMPIFEYTHIDTDYCSVTGGFVYRGRAFPDMVGHYFLADYCAGVVWDLDLAQGWAATLHEGMRSSLAGVSTFGQDVYGELYLANINSGALYHLMEDTPITLLDGDVYLPLLSR